MIKVDARYYDADNDLKQRIINFLFLQHLPHLRHMEVSAENGVVTIRGRVGSFYQRQLCINCCQRVAGVVQIRDEINVVSAVA